MKSVRSLLALALVAAAAACSNSPTDSSLQAPDRATRDGETTCRGGWMADGRGGCIPIPT